MRRATLVLAGLLLAAVATAEDQVGRLMKAGNWAQALDLAKERLESGEGSREDLSRAVECLNKLNRVVEFDALVEGAVKRYADDAPMLITAAKVYSSVHSHGHLVAGEFRRGSARGPAESVNAQEVDRVRRLRLALAGYKKAGTDQDAVWACQQIAESLTLWRTGKFAWRLQSLTALDGELPEPSRRWGGAPGSDAPVNAAGDGPLLYEAPATWEAAKSDGERFRWALAEQQRRDPAYAASIDTRYADFLREQFGVQTLRGWSGWGRREDDAPTDATSALAVETLDDGETIARLATGVKRFELPEGHRFVELYRRHEHWDRLFDIYLNRNQREKAVEAGEAWLAKPGDYVDRNRIRKRLEQLTKPWAQFGVVSTQTADEGAEFRLRSRNAAKVELVAKRVDVAQLLADVRQAIREQKESRGWWSLQVEQFGGRLLKEQGEKYLGESVADWKVAVDARPDHADSETTVASPLQEAGAYFVTATPIDADGERGAETNVVVWVADTVLVRKPTAAGVLYQTLDARTGRPVPGATLDLFGYRQERQENGKPRIETTRVAEKTDEEGIALLDLAPEQGEPGYNWLSIATTAEGRLAHLGFAGVWRQRGAGSPNARPRTHLVTDRPVYRPGDTIQFKAWVGKPDYAEAAIADGEPAPAPSPYAHQEFRVELFDARGEKVDTQRLTADAYGALEGSYTPDEGAPLGVYRINVAGFGGGSFRVEEYRKPEFEVTVDAPKEPTRLGDAFEATVRATYYAGSPVRGGKVKYRVTRTARYDHWLPIGRWDWLYGRGYGWLGEDAVWRPGWNRWGCFGPAPPWRPFNPGPPETVAEGTAALDGEGEFLLPIDTATTKELFGDRDHTYRITAEVTDAGRRTITGAGSVIAARRPVEVTVWLDRGYYEAGDTMRADVAVRRPDGAPVAAGGELRLLKLAPLDQQQAAELKEPAETLVQSWALPTDADGSAEVRMKASEPGRYRLVYRSEAADESVEGGLVFTIRGPGFDDGEFQYNALELIPDKAEYAPGETVRLLVNSDRRDATVTLFVRPVNGVYSKPSLLRLEGKSSVVELPVTAEDLPNFYVEAHTVTGGELHTVTKRIVVPPESRVLKVEASPSATTYLPGEEGKLSVKITDEAGEPVVGAATIAVYDRSVDAIAGGASSGDIRKAFWSWTRSHYPNTTHNLTRREGPVTRKGVPAMQRLGVFGDVGMRSERRRRRFAGGGLGGGGGITAFAEAMPATAAPVAGVAAADLFLDAATGDGDTPAIAVRENFADTALWVGSVETDENGLAEVALPLPESLTAWRVRAWAVGDGLRVGQGEAEVVTRKELMARLRAPRFLVERDEAVISALVQNESPRDLTISVTLQADGESLILPPQEAPVVSLAAGEETLVDWRVRAAVEGTAKLRVIAETIGEGASLSDAMQVELPVLVHGAEIVESQSRVLGPDDRIATLEIVVPAKRRPEATRLEVRYSPTLVGSMLDALPYLIEYPHGCTEQTLNRFLPAVLVRKTIEDLGVDLSELKPNGEGPAGPPESRSPVFDREELDRITRKGVTRLMEMQLSDGGWGWFSGWGEHSSAHTTAVVVRGLGLAKRAGVALPDDVLNRGLDWLTRYRAEQEAKLKNFDHEKGEPRNEDRPSKRHADNLDALVELTLIENDRRETHNMLGFLYRDRLRLSPYSQAMLGLALHTVIERSMIIEGLDTPVMRDTVIRNLRQFVQTDDENQTAWLNLPGGYWWYWYGSEYEAQATFLRLLTATEPKGELAPKLVKYLLNNRRHAARWNSTRDTALVIEAMAEYAVASGEAAAEGTVEVWLDGKRRQTRAFDAATALRLDGRFVLAGDQLSAGRHTLELRKTGAGRLYAGSTLTNFSLEDDLRAAGLEVRIKRRVQKLVPITESADDVDSRGGVATVGTTRYRRVNVPNLGAVNSGDLVEVELTLTSKNDYEYLLIEDPKPAGFEPVETRSGYNGNAIGAYAEFRDERVLFYARRLPRGERTLIYRLRAETPGRYAALPAAVSAMYAPDLRGNSDEIKLRVEDAGEAR